MVRTTVYLASLLHHEDWKLSWNAGNATTKRHRLGGFTNRHLFLTVPKPNKFKIRVPE